MLTEPDIKRTRKWSDARWSELVANGFPKARGYRETYDADGYPTGRIALWVAEDISRWEQAIAQARVGQ